MTLHLKKTVVLVGMMGAGKTAVGTAVARHLDVPFIDQDDEIQRASNSTIAEIFANYGEPFFREKETQVLSRLLAGDPCILSTGGGAFLSARNRDLISEMGASVWLKADLPLLWSRVRHKSTRPLLLTNNPHETLKSLCEVRNPVYALASIHVKSQARFSVEDMAQEVIGTLRTHPDILKDTENA